MNTVNYIKGLKGVDKIEVSAKKEYKPLREIEVEYDINDDKCKECKDRPCLRVCPVEAVHEISHNNHIEIDEKCVG